MHQNPWKGIPSRWRGCTGDQVLQRPYIVQLAEAAENNLIQYLSKYNPEALTQCCVHSIVYMHVQNTEPNVSSSRLWSE